MCLAQTSCCYLQGQGQSNPLNVVSFTILTLLMIVCVFFHRFYVIYMELATHDPYIVQHRSACQPSMIVLSFVLIVGF